MQAIELTEAEKVLLQAADHIEEYGWCQNDLWKPDGICAGYAISLVRQSDSHDKAIKELERRIGRHVVEWNDDPHQTKENVLATMRMIDRS